MNTEELVKLHNEEYIAKYPKFCTKCNGYGGKAYYESHGSSYGPSEEFFEPCDALPLEICHRCGEEGFNEEGEGSSCSKCGFNSGDDGLWNFYVDYYS